MTGRTHDLAAFTSLLLVFLALPQTPSMSLATAIGAFGANFVGGLFPDIDQPTSDLWDNFRLGPFIAKIVCPALGGHRHFSHSLLGLIVIGYGSRYILGVLASLILIDMHIVWYAFMIGVVSHILMDMPTKAGVPLLWPIPWKFGIPPIRALRIESGTWIEHWVVFPVLFVFTGMIIWVNLEFFRAFLKTLLG